MSKYVVLIYPRPTGGYLKERRRDIHNIRRIYAPLSIMYLASTLEKAGFPVILLDDRLMTEEEMTENIFKAEDILFFGISSMTGSQISNGLRIARMLRSNYGKNIPVVWGGVHPTIYPKSTINHDLVDIIVLAEGDNTVVELARVLDEGKSLNTVKGICFKVNGTIEMTPMSCKIDPLDDLPIPSWHHLEEYLNPAQYPFLATITTSRGCPFACTYCYKGEVDSINKGDIWRGFSVKRIMHEIDYLQSEFGFDVFESADENFILHADRAIELIREFKSRGIKISAIRSKFNTFKDKVVKEFPDFCDYVAYSPETGSSRIQDYLRKKDDYNKMKLFNAKVRDMGLSTVHNFIFAFPFETEEDILATVNLCKEFKKINPISRMSLYQYMPYPGAPLTDLMQKEYSLVLPENLEEWSHSDMYGELSLRFRPWVKEKEVSFLNNFQLLFNIVFNTYKPLDKEVYSIYESDSRIKRLMGDISSIPRAVGHVNKNKLDERLDSDLYSDFQERVFV